MVRKATLNMNRAAFTPEDMTEYEHKRGCFVSTKTALFLALLGIVVLIGALLLYYFFVQIPANSKDDLNDIEKLLDESLKNLKNNERLPTDLIPMHYRIKIQPFLQEENSNSFSFKGHLTLVMNCKKATKKIVLNSENLEIFKEEVTLSTSTKIQLKSMSQVLEVNSTFALQNSSTEVPSVIGLPPEPRMAENKTKVDPHQPIDEFHFNAHVSKTINISISRQELINDDARYIIYSSTTLKSNTNYTLDIPFRGKISNNLVGLYKTSYLSPDGTKKWLLTTNLQPVFARRVFPCFDEPSFKALFQISIARRTNMTTLSNMPLMESEPVKNQAGWVWDHFQRSPPMAPHSVAFTVSDFEKLTPNKTTMGTVFSIWGPKHLLPNAQYALNITPKIINHLENYFNVKYPLMKLDLLIIPELSQSATESWGLLSFRDTSLLLPPNSTSWELKNHVFKTLANKLTKQWLGNLVTIKWWSDLWFIEGFSTYMEDVIENAIDPTLEGIDLFPLRVTQTILDSNKLKSIKSLQIDIKDLTQIEQLFDDTSSNKGSCLIRMLNYTLTEPILREGLESYIKTWRINNSDPQELWKILSKTAQKNSVVLETPIEDFMSSWIKQEGYPVVTINRNYQTGAAIINQSRYVLGNATHKNLWHIPLTYIKGSQKDVTNMMWIKKESSITILNFSNPSEDEWVLFNIDGAGLYRVNYDTKNWELLKEQLLNDSTQIVPSNRGSLLNDAFASAQLGMLSYQIPFELTRYLDAKEKSYIPWLSFFNSLQSLHYIIASTPCNEIFEDFIANKIEPLYKVLGTQEQSESLNDKILRKIILRAACTHNYEPCLQWAKKTFEEWMSNENNSVPFEFRQIVYCTAIKIGGKKEWNFLWKQSLQPTISSDDLKIIYLSLGCSREAWIINGYLEKSLNGSIAIQNTPYVWKSISHAVGLKMGMTFLRTHWDTIFENNQHIFSNLNSIFDNFLSKLSHESDLEDLTLFYQKHNRKLHTVATPMLKVVDQIKWRIAWRDKHLKTIQKWLMENTK